MVLNANAFLRSVIFSSEQVSPYNFCHRPIIVSDAKTLLGKVITKLKVHGKTSIDDVIANDLILLWSDDKRVITGTDILGRLLRGITSRD
jgi:hypothetical protein